MASAQSSTKLTRKTKPVEAAAMAGLNDAVINDGVIEDAAGGPAEVEKSKTGGKQKPSGLNAVIDGFLTLLSSVPFGIVLLILLIIACMIGMLIQQQELESFPAYFAELTPAEKVAYGYLGFFDIYHAVYFHILLLLLSLNIILASIDHFPAAWSFISRKKLTASPTFAMAQKFKEKVELPQLGRQHLAERAVVAARKMRFKARVTEAGDRTTIFAERGVWNRLGAYAVHIGLLTIFIGYFMTSRGYTGSMQIRPGQSSKQMVKNEFNIDNATTQHAIGVRQLTLPFTVECLDFQQKLIKEDGSLDQGNTLNWITTVRITDEETKQKTDAMIHMNTPFDYRGYRFFQASYSPPASARSIKLRVTPASGGQSQEITIQRDGEAKLADGTRLRFNGFHPNFSVGRDQKVQMTREDFSKMSYENPAANLAYVMPDGKQGEVWAINEAYANTIANAPFMKKFMENGAYQFVMTGFEKASTWTVLSIQFDEGAKVVYVGFTILCLMLIAVFFFSHQRLWIVVEDGNVYLGGDANRNRLGFEDRAKKVAELIRC
ncbi:MAG TPA: cytochrome c biogenesis protein ResB [Blastocatellia bacterium]|nr:cytochrome c biogenesis protein ResB [Blastocatellia bacterium]